MERTIRTTTDRGPAAWFTGDVFITMITTPRAPSRLTASSVHFTPGARTHWHSHAAGQTLHVTEGEGFVASRDGGVVRVRPGETIWIAADEEHWHGASDDALLCHIAMVENTDGGGDPTTWLEPVTAEQYRAAHQQ